LLIFKEEIKDVRIPYNEFLIEICLLLYFANVKVSLKPVVNRF